MDLEFKPLTEGLGFHPFSDGLPYAPITRSRASTAPVSGTGATAAGRVRVATTAPVVPRVSVPVSAPVSAAAPAVRLTQIPAPTFGFVYVLKRVLAYGLDTALNTVLCGAALAASLWNQNLDPRLLMNPGVVALAAIFLFFFSWALMTAQEVAFSTTIGKRLFGLALQGGAAAIFLRAFFFLPSLGFGGMGILWAALDSRRRCWHDCVVDLQPDEIAWL